MSSDTATTTEKHPVDQTLPFLQMFTYGLQHVLSMYAGVVAVPLIVGTALKLSGPEITYLVSAGLFISGLATLLQTIGVWKFGARQPIVQGTSFAAVSTILAVGTAQGGVDGLRAVFGALIVAGLLGLLIAPVFTRLLRFFPEVVTGVVITVIGISLLPVAIRWAAGGTPGTPTFGDPKNIAVAAITMALIVLIYRFLPGAFGRVAILLGLVLGTVVAIPFGLTNFSRIADANIVQLTLPFHFGLPTFAVGAIVSMFIVMLVIMTETTADILAIGQVIDKPADRQTVTNGLRADMLSTSVAAIFNGFSVSAFAQNVGLVAVTKIKSRYVVAAGGVILVLLGLLPVLGRVVAAVPTAVLGGAGIVLFGTVAASGIRTLAKVEYRNNMNLIIVAASLGFGMIPIAAPTFYDKFPSWFGTIFHSGISSAAVMAILLNLLFNHLKKGNSENQSVFVAGTGRVIREEDLQCLAEGDRYENGKLIDCDGKEVPVETTRAAADEHHEATRVATDEH
jgi:uric acid transporter